MMRLCSTILLALFAFTALIPRAAAQADSKAKVSQLLEQSAKEFLAAIDTVNEDQWSFKGNGLKHSIGDEAEHVAFAEQELQQIITKALKSTAQPAAAAKLKGKEVEIRKLMLEGERGVENFKPRGRLLSKLEVLEYFTAAHKKLMQQLAGAKDIDNYVYKHPNKNYGDMTARQWFYYVAYHKMRHIEQIEAIKAHKDFPGRVRTAELRLELAAVQP